VFCTVYHSEASSGNAIERLSFSRLETRTKEFSSRASRRVIQTPMRIERDVYDRDGFISFRAIPSDRTFVVRIQIEYVN